MYYESTVSDTEMSDFYEEEDMEQVMEDERNERIDTMVDYLDHRFNYETVWEPMYDIYTMDLNRLYDIFTFMEVHRLDDREFDILSRWYRFESSREEESAMDVLCTLCEICETPINPWTLGNALKYCRI